MRIFNYTCCTVISFFINVNNGDPKGSLSIILYDIEYHAVRLLETYLRIPAVYKCISTILLSFITISKRL